MYTPQPEWRKIPDLPERHEVSSCGRVRTLSFVNAAGRRQPEREKKVCFSRVGKTYLAGMVRISDGGKERVLLVHRLVASAFIGSCPQNMEVLHIDGDSTNNNLTNLRYGTRKENVADTYRHGKGNDGEKHPMAKLSDAQVSDIREMLEAGHTGVSIASRFGISSSNVSLIKNGHRRGGRKQ